MINEVWTYSLISVLIVSLISFIGLVFVGRKDGFRKILVYVISFAAGALFGDAFLHLLPESVGHIGFGVKTSIYFLLGIVLFLILEKFVHWQHCHGEAMDEKHKHIHPFAYMNLVGDGLHNFLDGLIIGASYLVSFPVGIATTIAIVLHEIPQEIGDFAVLIHGGFSKGKALALNLASAVLAFVGVIVALSLSGTIENIEIILSLIAAGGFVYIAGSDLIPEVNRHLHSTKHNFWQLVSFVLGIGIMALLLLIG